MEELRLLVCSDLHGSEDALSMLSKAESLHSFDAVVICGDFTTFGSPDYVNKVLSSFRSRVLAIPGNCDTRDIVDLLESRGANLHRQRVLIRGWTFFGFGGGVTTSAQMPFETEEDEIGRALRDVAVKGGVMVTHMPAYGMNDRTRSGKNKGSKVVREIAYEFRPRLALSGHIHEARGFAEDHGTVFCNPGSAREGFHAAIMIGESVDIQLHEDTQLSQRLLKSF